MAQQSMNQLKDLMNATNSNGVRTDGQPIRYPAGVYNPALNNMNNLRNGNIQHGGRVGQQPTGFPIDIDPSTTG